LGTRILTEDKNGETVGFLREIDNDSMTGGGTGGTSSDWAAVVLGAGPGKRLIDAGFNLALSLAADCCQF
jgi:hypothetical protein